MIWYLFGLGCLISGALLVLVAYCWQIAEHLKGIHVLMLESKIHDLEAARPKPRLPDPSTRGRHL